MNKVLRLFFFFFLTISCSLDKKSGLWTKADKIENAKDLVIVELFKEEKNFNNEFNKYYSNRIKRIRKVNQRSKLNYFIFHLSNPILVLIRNIILKMVVSNKKFLNEYLGQIYLRKNY